MVENVQEEIEEPVIYLNEMTKKQRRSVKKQQFFECSKCHNDKGKYLCPKCKLYQCGLKCYQTHNQECTESFYQENVLQDLKNFKSSEEMKQSMLKILDREKLDQNEFFDNIEFNEKEQKQIKEFELLYEKFLNNELTFETLTHKQQQEFLKFVEQNQNLSKVVKEWTPWWIHNQVIISNQKDTPSLYVEEVDIDEEKQLTKKQLKIKKIRMDIKNRYIDLKPFEQFKVNPNEELVYHIVNIMYATCFTYRFCNGDVYNQFDDSSNMILEIGQCLGKVGIKNYYSMEVTLKECYENQIKISDYHPKVYQMMILDDLLLIFRNPFLIVESFFRLYDYFHQYQQVVKNNKIESLLQKEHEANKILSNKISNIKNKIIFILSFIKSLPLVKIHDLRQDIQLFKDLLMQSQDNINEKFKAFII